MSVDINTYLSYPLKKMSKKMSLPPKNTKW